MPLAGQPEPDSGSLGLGRKIVDTPAPAPVAAPVPVNRDGTVTMDSRGNFSTNILGNEKANPVNPNDQTQPDDMSGCFISILPPEDPEFPRYLWGTW